MDDTASFSSRSNAKRAAEKMIANGAAPAVDYGFKPRDDGRFEIVWKTDKAKAKASPTTDEVEAELAAACEQAEAGWSEAGEAEAEAAQAHPGANGAESSLAANDPAESEEAATAPPPRPATAAESPAADPAAASDPFARIWDPAAEKLEQHKDWLRDQAAAQAEPENQWPEGTRVMVRKGKSWSEATMVRRLDVDYWRVEFPRGGSGVFEEADIRSYDDAHDPKPAKQPRRARATAPRAPRAESRSRYGIDPAAIAAGKLPDKAPVVSSATNQLYQKKFDALHAHAVAGEWDAVRDFKITGSNSYSKMVERYRQDLLAVHKAQAEASAATGQC
jgi:hypothetical protein